MSDGLTASHLRELEGMLNNLLSPRVKRGGSSAEAAARDLINFYKDCSCKKVFADVRGGKLPPLSEQDITDEVGVIQ